MFTKRWLVLPAALALCVVLAMSCGDDDDDDDGDDDRDATTEESGDDVESEDIDITGIAELEDGNLVVLSDLAYPPIDGLDENDNPVGVDIDIAEALAEKLGVEFEFQISGFDTIIESLNAEDGDMIMSAMTVTPERDEQVDFVEYLAVGSGIAVQPGNPEGIASSADLCGLRVGAQEGTIQEDQLQELNANECADNQIDLAIFPDQPTVTQELGGGNADAMLADVPVILDAEANSDGAIEALDVSEGPFPYGIAYRTDSPFGAVLQQALDAIIADGTYDAILENYGLTATSIVGS